MADSPHTGPGDGDVEDQAQHSNPHTNSTPQQQSTFPHQRQGRAVDGNRHRLHDGTQIPAHLHSANSRYSLNEQFAASRQDFQFGDEDELDSVEVMTEIRLIPDTPDGLIDDSFKEISDSEINQLLQTNEDTFVDHYSLLGLPRDPPPADTHIRSAYHRLSLAFHPDKHPNHLKDAAERYFTRLRLAYETLIDPKKRIIYDLEGEEGVKNEYGQGGAMGPGGESNKQLSSVNAMNADEFKKWFLGVLYQRERRAIETLVNHKSEFKIGLDASSNFIRKVKIIQNGSTVFTIPNQRLQIQEIGVQASFTIPMAELGRCLEVPMPSARQVTASQIVPLDEKEEMNSSDWINALGPSVPKLTITGGVSGKILEGIALKHNTSFPANDALQGERLPFFDQFYSMTTQQIGFGARLSHTFPEILGTGTENSIASRLQGLDVEIETTILPHPAAATLGLGKAVCFIADTTPFYVYVHSTVKDLPILKPPEVGINITRALGLRGSPMGYFTWQSGETQWPSFISQSLAGVTPSNLAYVARWLSQGRSVRVMKLGAIWSHKEEALGEDNEVDDSFRIASRNGTTPPRTTVSAEAYAESAQLTVTYSCDVFSRYDEPPVRSRFMNSGDTVSQASKYQIHKSRGVRLEVEARIGFPAILDMTITGTRRMGKFTSVGLGVGVKQNMGLYFTLSWRRLGQSINVPVALLPLENVTTGAIMLAVGIPWALYMTTEFIIIRPRMRSRRQRLINAQRAKLALNVAKRREEAEQAVSLVYPSVVHRQAQERHSGGLVILNAWYGVRETDSGSWTNDALADVTIALASLVDDGQLNLPRSLDKNKLIGFWDPAPLVRKTLEVRYMFGGKEHLVEVKGKQALIIPSRAHELR